MLYYTIPQAGEFLAMLFAGILLGLLSLPFSLARKLMRAGAWVSLACDLLMGILWGAAICLSSVVICRGDMRAFHYCALISGAALFMAAASPALRVLARTAAAKSRAAFRACANSGICRTLFK